MGNDSIAIIGLIILIAAISVIAALICMTIFLWIKHKEKRYKKILYNNPSLSKKIRQFELTRQRCDFNLRVLSVKEKRCEGLRNKILTSLPEEKEELYKEIRKSETEVKKINTKVIELYDKWEKAYNNIINFAAETLKPKEYKFFCKQGGWQQNDE